MISIVQATLLDGSRFGRVGCALADSLSANISWMVDIVPFSLKYSFFVLMSVIMMILLGSFFLVLLWPPDVYIIGILISSVLFLI